MKNWKDTLEHAQDCTTAEERKARYMAQKINHRVCKARRKNGRLIGFGGLQLVDSTNTVRMGLDFDLNATVIIEYCEAQLTPATQE